MYKNLLILLLSIFLSFSCSNKNNEKVISEPTEEEIETAHSEWQTEYNSQEYARNRQTEYPQIGDQLDSLYHAGVFPSDMAAKLKAGKDANPKG